MNTRQELERLYLFTQTSFTGCNGKQVQKNPYKVLLAKLAIHFAGY
jgi:hypothetical protein